MTRSSATTQFGICAVVFVVSACSDSAGGPADATALGGTGNGGAATTATGSTTTGNRATGGSTTGGAATNATLGGSATVGGTATAVAGASVGGSSDSLSIGGSSVGGKATGGSLANAGGVSSGGKATGGAATGGVNAGGKATGGSATGGINAGGKATGGSATGGINAGGKATGGSATGGAPNGIGGGASIVLPTANASFDYQIGGAYTPPSGVQVVSRDRNSAPAQGLYNICYVNGFQIQPDEESFWTSQHSNLILKDASGKAVVDEDWGEILLDTSTAAKRTELATVVGSWIAKCKADGFNAVEVDNLDSYSRSSGLLTQANNVAFMALLSATAHANGLAIAQKNSSELLGSVAAMGTDFAVVEECNRYDECGTYQAVYDNLLFIIEYRSQDFQSGCSAYPGLSIVLRDLNVSTPSSSAYVYQGC